MNVSTDRIHRIEYGVVQAGVRTNPHLECVQDHHGNVCEFNEFINTDGHVEAMWSLRWPVARSGSNKPIRFPLYVIEERDHGSDEPTWEFTIIGQAADE